MTGKIVSSLVDGDTVIVSVSVPGDAQYRNLLGQIVTCQVEYTVSFPVSALVGKTVQEKLQIIAEHVKARRSLDKLVVSDLGLTGNVGL